MKKENIIKINGIGNSYGGLYIGKHKTRCYWIIENWNTEFTNIDQWKEIPKTLYEELKYNTNSRFY